jgi:iron complex transport system permease protein
MFTALLAGAGLSLAGLLMQTLFNNPLAGPYVLGINTGSSLFVAASMMTGFSFFESDAGLLFTAVIGAIFFGFIILGFSLFVRSQVALLLIGLMLGSFAGAIITAIQATTSAQQLKAFTMWTMGSLQQTRFDQLPVFLFIFSAAMVLTLFLIKPLNALVLGDQSTEILGFNLKRLRVLTIALTAILTGLITAFCGPIAFVGLAVPNITKMLFKTTSHQILLLGTMLIGSVFLLLVDTIIQLCESNFLLPLNAFTSIIGAPIIIFIIFKRMA